MSDSSDDKQLPATAKRLKTAREEGQIARSRDLGHFALVAVSLGVLAASARPAIEHLRDLTAAALRFDVVTLKSPERMLERLHDMGLSVLPMVIVFGLVGAVAVLAAAVASGGWVFTTKVLEPKFEKRALGVEYELTQHTLAELEDHLEDKGYHLDNTLMSKLTRALIHYVEETQLHNMVVPEKRLKPSPEEAYVKAWETRPHGDHDDTPPEWREYK